MVFVSRIVLCEHSQAEHEGPLTQEEVVHEEVVVEGGGTGELVFYGGR